MRTVQADFFLNPAERLTEQERALMTAMLHCLVDDVVDAVRSRIPGEWCEIDDQDDLTVIDRLAQVGLLNDADLIALLLRRADEERISVAARARAGRPELRVLQGLVSHHGGDVSAAAMALIIARGRRRDRVGQCLLLLDDLSPSAAEAMIHAVAAALRGGLARRYGPVAVDRELGAAARETAAAYDSARSEDALTAALVEALHQTGTIEDSLMLSAATEGEVRFVAYMLARRAELSGQCALDELLSGDAGRVSLLFRLAGVPRTVFAGILGGVGDILGLSDPARAIAQFDLAMHDQIEAARSWLSAGTEYRQAVTRLEAFDGQRAL